MRRAGSAALSLLLLALSVAGCVDNTVYSGPPRNVPPGTQPPGASPRAALWDEAAAHHPASGEWTASRVTLQGALTPSPPLPRATVLSRAGLDGAASATRFLFLDATRAGERGTLHADAPPGVTIAAPELPLTFAQVQGGSAGFSADFPVHLGGGFSRINLSCGSGEGCRDPQLPAEARVATLATAGTSFPAGVTVSGTNLTFYDMTGNLSWSGVELHLDRAGDFGWLSKGFGGAVGVDLQDPGAWSWADNLTANAEGVAGKIIVSGTQRDLSSRVAELRYRAASGHLSMAREGDRVAVRGLAGDLTDAILDGAPRLGAAFAALPQVIDVEAPAGEVARFHVLLAEGSGGARAHLDPLRVESNTSLGVKFEGSQPFPVTRALFDLAGQVANATDRMTPLVTVPILIGLGVAIPLVALLEGFVGFFQALFPPSLPRMLEPGAALDAKFLVKMPHQPAEATLIFGSANAGEQRVLVHLNPRPAGNYTA